MKKVVLNSKGSVGGAFRFSVALCIVFCALWLSGCDQITGLLKAEEPSSAEILNPGDVVVEIEPIDEGETQEWVPSIEGYYLIELWGAQGWNPPESVDPANQYGGKGAYVRGILAVSSDEVEEAKKLTVAVAVVGDVGAGEKGGTNGGGSNKSGMNEGGGGGASDVRWGGDTLHDRIIVAAGGGGASDTSKVGSEHKTIDIPFWKGGFGGAFTGGDSDAWPHTGANGQMGAPGFGATQEAGGVGGYYHETGGPGEFGLGGSYTGLNESCGGGGGGYWGGGSGGQWYYNGGGGGGSSFISGYEGCVAIISSESTKPRTDSDATLKATHYSGKVFESSLKIGGEEYTTEMISGDKEMPTPEGEKEIGHSGGGYARITYLGK
jgi:hypothetical protein